MDSESDFGSHALTGRLVMLLSSSSGHSLDIAQAAGILGVDVSALLHEVNLGGSVMEGWVQYDSKTELVSLRQDVAKASPPAALDLPPVAPSRNAASDTESQQQHRANSFLRQLRQGGGYRSDSNAVPSMRRRGAVRKARPGLGLTQPPTHDQQVGRVGYVCVAEEFNLGAIENHYRSQGYYTKFDFDVLHVRFADSDMHAAEEQVAARSASGYGSTDANHTADRSDGGAGSLHGGSDDATSSKRSAMVTQRTTGFDLFLFEYGAVVWWGFNSRYFKIVETDFMLPQSPISKFMSHRYPTQLVNENYPVWCTFNLVLKETLEIDQDFKDLLRFDHFLIPYGRGDPSTCSISMLCASHALAQSAKIDYLEIKVQELTVSCTPLPRELREKGTVTVSERRLLQLRGEVLSYRLMLRSGSDLIDEPSFFWENAYLKPVFQATKEGFEISTRVEALDNKLDATNEILSMLADEFSQRHGARLEWIVIWLVFVEVIIGVLELCVDIRPWIRAD